MPRRRRGNDAAIRTYDDAGNVIEATSTRAISKNGEAIPCNQRNPPGRFLKKGYKNSRHFLAIPTNIGCRSVAFFDEKDAHFPIRFL
jgi:hypothetical protein